MYGVSQRVAHCGDGVGSDFGETNVHFAVGDNEVHDPLAAVKRCGEGALQRLVEVPEPEVVEEVLQLVAVARVPPNNHARTSSHALTFAYFRQLPRKVYSRRPVAISELHRPDCVD